MQANNDAAECDGHYYSIRDGSCPPPSLSLDIPSLDPITLSHLRDVKEKDAYMRATIALSVISFIFLIIICVKW